MRQLLLIIPILLACELSLAQSAVKPGLEWPRPIPARIRDSDNKDLMVMTLGDVKTILANGIFDPAKDEVRLNDGTVKPNYYKVSLGIKYFQPIDKSKFSLPPSGWCSWYFYYQEINEGEVKRNADWIAANLKDYGAVYVQLDDGWQGTGHGLGENRDWTTIDKRFAGGMDRLAAYIKSRGLKPGIWLAPQGLMKCSFPNSIFSGKLPAGARVKSTALSPVAGSRWAPGILRRASGCKQIRKLNTN